MKRLAHARAVTDWEIQKRLNLLLVVQSRLEEVLISSIVRQTPHRLHIVDSPEMGLRSLHQQAFDVIMICDRDAAHINEVHTALQLPQSSIKMPVIGICCQQPLNSALTMPHELTDIACLLHPPITEAKLKKLLTHFMHKAKAKIISNNR